VPTRALAKTARLIREVRAASTYGIAVSEPALDWSGTVAMVRKVIAEVRARKDDTARLDEAGVNLVDGEHARFLDDQTSELSPSGRQVRFTSAIVCVGGHSRRLPVPGAEHTVFAEHVLDVPQLPGRVTIIGSGATGAQLVTIFNAFGCEVTVLEMADRVLPAADHDVSATLERSFRAHGVDVVTGIDGVERIERIGADLRVSVTAGQWQRDVTADLVVSSVGWPATVEGLDLDAAGVAVEGGIVPVNQYLQSSVPSIYVAGDANGRVMLVQTARSGAETAAENAVLGPNRAARQGLVPWGGFTDPDVAGVGLTEHEARARDRDCVVATVHHRELERAIIDDRTEGFCKLIADRHRSLVLGAHATGESAVEVIQAVTTAMAAGVDVATLASVQFAYPTYTAAVGIAARRLLSA
jgi:glutathione reductase (NADPH)